MFQIVKQLTNIQHNNLEYCAWKRVGADKSTLFVLRH